MCAVELIDNSSSMNKETHKRDEDWVGNLNPLTEIESEIESIVAH